MQTIKRPTENIIIVTFIVTALYDVLLRGIVEEKIPDPSYLIGLGSIKNSDWGISLVPYFEKHTILSAALIAGFVGAITQVFILYLLNIDNLPRRVNNLPLFLLITFIVSGLFGFVMKATPFFPILKETYYKDLGPTRAACTDAYSGVIVNLTLFVLYYSKLLKY